MKIIEGSVVLHVPFGAPRKNDQAFYNPEAKLSRDIGIALIFALGKNNLRAADVLSGTGARTLRLIKETPKGTFKKIFTNDINPKSTRIIKQNAKENKISQKIKISNNEATLFLMGLNMMDYIDIDPFGSPVPFVDTAMRRLAKGGVLAIAATDTAALTGASFQACVRKYNARPLHGEMMHEIGMRILVKKVQEIAGQHEKALTPIYCHSSNHYMRAYFKCENGAEKTKNTLSQHGFVHYCYRCLDRHTSKYNEPKKCCGAPMTVAGPLWLGNLWDEQLAKKMERLNISPEAHKLTKNIAQESKIQSLGTFSLPHLSSVLGKNAPKQEKVFETLQRQGYKAALSHFGKELIRTNAPLETMKKLFKK